MKAHVHDPCRLDVEVLARDAAQLAGRWSLDDCERLRSVQVPGDGAPAELIWNAQGECLQSRAGEAELWMHVSVTVVLRLQCQRCLQPMAVPIDIQRAIRFVRGEDEAAALDADLEEDVLALTRSLNLRELVEDEVLLALPLVPRHEVCSEPLAVVSSDSASEVDQPHPFAVLAQWRGRPPGK